jgi:hypothetical protein
MPRTSIGWGSERPLRKPAYPALDDMYASWSIPAMGAVTAARMAGRNPDNFKIVNENFDQIVALNMAENGFIAGISSQRPYDQGVAEAKIGALTLIGETTPTYVVVPPLKVTRDTLAEGYRKIYRIDLPARCRRSSPRERLPGAAPAPGRARLPNRPSHEACHAGDRDPGDVRHPQGLRRDPGVPG